MLAAFGTTLNLASLWASRNSCSSDVVCRRLRRTLTPLIFPFGLDIWSIDIVQYIFIIYIHILYEHLTCTSKLYILTSRRRSSIRNLTSKSNSFRRILAPVSVGSLTSNGVFCLTVADSIATSDSKTTKGTTTNMADCCIVLNLLGNKRSNMDPSFYTIISSVRNKLYLLYVSECVRLGIDFCTIFSYYKQINSILNKALIKMSDTSPAV